MKDMVYYYRHNKDFPLSWDIEWAEYRFKKKFGRDPYRLIINPLDRKSFEELNSEYEIVENSTIENRRFGLV